MRELHQKDLIARRDVIEAETVVETARAEKDVAQSQVEQREAAVAQVRYLVALTRVSAPLSGVVTRRLVKEGDRVPAAAPLVTIANVATLSVASELPAQDSDRLSPGTAVQILPDGMPARPFSGILTQVRPAGSSPTTRTAEIRVANQDGVLKPGLKVSVWVPTTAPQVVLVPRDAVFEIGEQTYLYTVDGDKARLRQVEKAWEKAGEVAITSNLTDGEKVVISSRDRLQPNVTVRVID
jgi:RND family efflux transporter MFP subunit